MGIVVSKQEERKGRAILITFFCDNPTETVQFDLERVPDDTVSFTMFGRTIPSIERAEDQAEHIFVQMLYTIAKKNCSRISIKYLNGGPDIANMLNALDKMELDNFNLALLDILSRQDSVFQREETFTDATGRNFYTKGLQVLFEDSVFDQEYIPVRRKSGFVYHNFHDVLERAAFVFKKRNINVSFYKRNQATGMEEKI